MKQAHIWLLAIPILTTLSCGGLFGRGDDSPIQSYTFSPREFTQQAETTSQRILLVSPVQSVGLDSRRMAYSMRPYESNFYAFSQWADTPPRMLEPLLVQAMESSGLFAAVIDVSSSAPADLRLDVDLLVAQHEFHTARSQGRLVLRAQLNDLAENRILATRLFEAARPAPSENAYGGVLAINLALEDLLRTLVTWVGEQLP
jgi:cholesterol transport system auxiliary component